jgi:putative FmdB family regulatory protein
MPTYDYTCPACGEQVVHHHKMSDSPEYKCDNESCKKKGIEILIKLISPVPVHFIGRKWYGKDGY